MNYLTLLIEYALNMNVLDHFNIDKQFDFNTPTKCRDLHGILTTSISHVLKPRCSAFNQEFKKEKSGQINLKCCPEFSAISRN